MIKEIKLNYNVPISESGILDNEFIIQGVAINATITGNNHKFLVEELRESASTLNGVPLLVDHKNEVSAIKGRVTSGEFDEVNTRINFKAKVVDSDIKRMVKEGLINSVSVGAAVREIEEKDDVLIPRGITFKELSLVAVPADAGATFTTALQEAYKLIEQEKVKCPECGKMIPKDEMKVHMDKMHEEKLPITPVLSQSIPEKELSQSMKGGIKMSEEKTEQAIQKIEVKEVKVDNTDKLIEMIGKLSEKINSMEIKLEKKAEVPKVEEDEDITEVKYGKYKIVQGLGSLRGASFTIVR